MKKILVLLGIILLSLSTIHFSLYLKIKQTPIEKPSWKLYALDKKSPSRFVDLAYDNNSNVHIFYFAERTKRGLREFYSIIRNNSRIFYNRTIKPGKSTGFFISAESTNDSIYVSFQDYILGNEKLYLANLSLNSLKIYELDNVTKSGLGVGMYSKVCIVNKKPLVFYHVAQGRKFMVNNLEDSKLLENNTGWDISCETINNTVYLAYRGRDDMYLRLAKYNPETKNLDSKLHKYNVSSITTFVFNNTPYVVFYDHDNKTIYLSKFEPFKPKPILKGDESTIKAAVFNNTVYILYSHYRRGLYLLNTTDLRNFTSKTIDNRTKAGLYSAIKISKNNDIGVAYIANNTLYLLEYQKTPTVLMEKEISLKGNNQKQIAKTLTITGMILMLLGFFI